MYHTIVGTPVLTPMWALGWHQSRYGYKNIDELKAVRNGYKSHSKYREIPLESIWADIDYMQDYRDFTYNNETFKGLPEYVKQL